MTATTTPDLDLLPSPGPWKAEAADGGGRLVLTAVPTGAAVAVLGDAGDLNPADVALLAMAPEMRHALMLIADTIRTAAAKVRPADPATAAQLEMAAGFALGAAVIEP